MVPKKSVVQSALYLKDAQLFLDECIRTHETVSITALKADGTVVNYNGWRVTSTWWRGGTVNLLNPRSGQTRKVRDVLIFMINNHPVYI